MPFLLLLFLFFLFFYYNYSYYYTQNFLYILRRPRKFKPLLGRPNRSNFFSDANYSFILLLKHFRMRNEPFQIISQKTVVGCPCVLPVIHLSKIKLVGLKCSDRKHRTIYLQFLFHPLQEKICSLGCISCILSCPQSLDK